MTTTIGRYPLSSAGGRAIPLGVAKPLALLQLPVTTVFSANVDTTTYQDKVMVALADQDCFISFLQTPLPPSNNTFVTELLHVPAGEHVVFVSNSVYLSAKSVAAGTLYIQVLEAWSGLSLETQLNRG